MRARLFLILRLCLGVVFIAAALPKIMDPAAFAGIIENYRILPQVLILPLAVILPWIEIISGICLISGFLMLGGLLVVNALMAVFFAAFGINIIRGIDVACGCFSLDLMAQKSTVTYLVRDAALLCCGSWLLFYAWRHRKRTDPIDGA